MKASDIPQNQGVTTTINNKPVAVYNDNGNLVVLENCCTHAGCQTNWNDKDKTWDCPCHLARFDKFGKVIKGPALKDLPTLPYKLENEEIILE